MRRLLAAAAAFAIVGLVLLPSPAGAFELSGCRLILQSFDENGEPLDTAIGDVDGGEGGTQDDPLDVAYGGTVRYEGDTGDTPITNFDWSVDVFLLPTPIRGSAANEDEATTAEGEVDVSAVLPVSFTGLVFVSGQLSGEEGSCRGGAWLRVADEETPAPATIPFWIAFLILIAGLLLLWAARPSLVVAGPYREVR